MNEQKPTFWSRLKDEIKEKHQRELESQKEKQGRKNRMDEEGVPYCPKCLSTSISANKKGFGIGKAVIGAAVAGPIGLIAGNINAKKIRVTCIKCGHQFWAGQK